jgi:hypothetical protein
VIPSLRAIAGMYLDGSPTRPDDSELERLTLVLVRVQQATFADSAREADAAGLERAQNRRQDNPAATYQAGACRAAYRIRERARAELALSARGAT